MILRPGWAEGDETGIPRFSRAPATQNSLPHSLTALHTDECDKPTVHFCSCTPPKNMAVTSNVFPLRLDGLKEAKCPRLRSIFSTHRCQNTSSGVAQVKSGEERISKLDRGTEQQIRGSWTSSTLHTTRSHSRSQGCTDACQFFRFKAKTSKRCSSPPCGGSSTFALIIQKKKKKCRDFSSAYSPSCSDCREIPTWQSAIKLSNPCMFFVHVFDRNGARRKTNMVKTLVFGFFFYPIQFNCVQSPWSLRAQHKLQMYTNVCKLFFVSSAMFFFVFLNNNRSIRTDLVWP